MPVDSEGRVTPLPPPLPDWERGTFEGAAYEQLRRGAAMTFAERVQLSCDMLELQRLIREGNAAADDNERSNQSISPP